MYFTFRLLWSAQVWEHYFSICVPNSRFLHFSVHPSPFRRICNYRKSWHRRFCRYVQRRQTFLRMWRYRRSRFTLSNTCSYHPSCRCKKVMRFLPPVVTGPIIICIGLSLSGSAINNASTNWLLAFIALATIIVFNIWGKGMFKIIPILMGVVVSYLCRTDFQCTWNDKCRWFRNPWFYKYRISLHG